MSRTGGRSRSVRRRLGAARAASPLLPEGGTPQKQFERFADSDAATAIVATGPTTPAQIAAKAARAAAVADANARRLARERERDRDALEARQRQAGKRVTTPEQEG